MKIAALLALVGQPLPEERVNVRDEDGLFVDPPKLRKLTKVETRVIKGETWLYWYIREAEDKLRTLKGAVQARENVTRRLAEVCGGGK